MKDISEILKELCNAIKSKGLEGTVTYRGELSHLVRCGCNVISLNTSEYTRRLQIEVQRDGRAVSGAVVYLPGNYEKAFELINSLSEKMTHMPVSEHLPKVEPLEAGTLPEGKMVSDFDSSAAVGLFEEIVAEFSEACDVSGACSGGVSEYLVMNTASAEPVGDRVNDFSFEAVLFVSDGSGRELRVQDCGNKFTIDSDKIINDLSRNLEIKLTTPREDIEPGEYDVVFSELALAQLTRFLSWTLFSGESYDLGTSMHDKGEDIGSQMTGPNISIVDDPTSVSTIYPRTVGMNGIKRGSFDLLKDGVQKQFYFSNKQLAKRFDRTINNDQSCSSLTVLPGKGPESFDELVKGCEEPVIYISFLHYMNITNSNTGGFSCMSRFGTYLLEGGVVKSHLYNLRINDSLKRIFHNVEWLSSTLKQVDLSDTYFLRNPTGISCPAMTKVKGLKIIATSAN